MAKKAKETVKKDPKKELKKALADDAKSEAPKKEEKEERFVTEIEEIKVKGQVYSVVEKRDVEKNGKEYVEVLTVEGCTYLMTVDEAGKYSLV